MRIMTEHIVEIGKGLEKANTAYNKAVGSMESRVLPAARRFKDLGAAAGSEIPALSPVETPPRALTAQDDKEDEDA
jgi:DNA recombination protein RmuC